MRWQVSTRPAIASTSPAAARHPAVLPSSTTLTTATTSAGEWPSAVREHDELTALATEQFDFHQSMHNDLHACVLRSSKRGLSMIAVHACFCDVCYNYAPTRTHRIFEAVDGASDNSYHIINKGSGMCMTLSGGDGSAVVQEPCDYTGEQRCKAGSGFDGQTHASHMRVAGINKFIVEPKATAAEQ